MEKSTEIFNSLSLSKKMDLFIGVYNLMARNNRFCGWVVYLDDRFLFFDSKPSFEDAFWVNTDELSEWINDLKQII
jgi:hypothetical protein